MIGIRPTVRACLLAVGLALCPSPRDAPRADDDRPMLAILPVKLLDTSGEPVDQEADHARRLAAMSGHLADDLGGRYRPLLLSAADLRAHCPEATPACLLDAAAAAGAGLVLVGVVHKSSTLILQIFVRLADARDGRTVFSRDLNFRGDSDDAWRRAGTFLARQILEAPRAGP